MCVWRCTSGVGGGSEVVGKGRRLIKCKDQFLILKYTLVTKYIYTRYMCVDPLLLYYYATLYMSL